MKKKEMECTKISRNIFERGDIILFSPSHEEEEDEELQKMKLGELLVGIVLRHTKIISTGSVLVEKHKYLVLVAGKNRILGHHSERLEDAVALSNKQGEIVSTITSKNHAPLNQNLTESKSWLSLKREVALQSIRELEREDIDFIDGKEHCSHKIDGIDLLVGARSLDRMGRMNGDAPGFRNISEPICPSTSKRICSGILSRASTIIMNHNSCDLLKLCLTSWQHLSTMNCRRKQTSAALIQKQTRRFLHRFTLEKQRQWVKWWKLHM